LAFHLDPNRSIAHRVLTIPELEAPPEAVMPQTV
jgi:hypothetical protein